MLFFESVKIGILMKIQGKLKQFSTAELIPLKADGKFWNFDIAMIFFLNQDRNLVKTYQSKLRC